MLTLCHACGMSCASRGGLARGVALIGSDRCRARATQRWMFRGPGRCSGCQAVLYKFQNWSHTRRCHSCGAALKFSRHAHYCESCAVFACKQCTDASRVLRCESCSSVLVGFQVTRASVNRQCDSCSTALEYRCHAYRCESCVRITCTQCTSNLRSGARRLISPVRNIRSGAVVRSRRCKRQRLSPAAGIAESEVRTTEHQPVRRYLMSTSAYRQRWSHPELMTHKRPRVSPAAGAAESEGRTKEQQPADKNG